MPLYQYEARDQQGATVTGQITAERVADALDALTTQGLEVLAIRALSVDTGTSEQKAAFYARLQEALSKKDELIPALDAIASELTDSRAARDLRELIQQLESNPSAEQFAKKQSTASWLPVVVRGIASQSTTDRYQQLLSDAARESENRKAIRKTLAYPIFLAIVGGVVLLFMLITVVPIFDRMFSEFGLRLPPPTELLVWLSRNVLYRLPQTLLFVSIIAIVFILLWRLWTHGALSTGLFGFFTAGSTRCLTAMARFTGSLAELISIGAPLDEALCIAGRACGDGHYARMAERLARDVSDNHLPLQQSKVARTFPPTMLYALDSQSHTATVSLLRELSMMYCERAQARTKWVFTLIAPASMVIIGGLVGFTVIALFMPLVSMITSLS